MQKKILFFHGLKMKDNNRKNFWKNKKVFITGHTGFKGAWLSIFLHCLGAKITGYSLKPEKKSLYNLANVKKIVLNSYFADVRDFNKLDKARNSIKILLSRADISQEQKNRLSLIDKVYNSHAK